MLRYAPDIPFPPYSYVTGRFPHPTRDPAGHSHGHVEAPPPAVEPASWNKSRIYLRALDLFNHGYYWEAHEAWESLWHVAGRRGAIADFLKGLIKLAAAGVKVREGRPDGVRRHARRAIELFRQVRMAQTAAATSTFCGLNIDGLIQFAEQISEDPPLACNPNAPVEQVLPFQLTITNQTPASPG